MDATLRDALVDELAEYGVLVEVGIGRRPDVAGELAARGREVRATDVHDCETPGGVAFVRDDVLDPRSGVYAGADAVYALNCPPELHRPLRDVAEGAGADCLFTTLGMDQPAIPVERRRVRGETVYVSTGGPER